VEKYPSPIDDIQVMEVLKGEKELCAVEATAFLVELLFALEVVEELSPIDESIPNRSECEM
jgi:hypothetical protein